MLVTLAGVQPKSGPPTGFGLLDPVVQAHRLVEQLREELEPLEHGQIALLDRGWLTDRVDAYGFMYLPGRCMWLLPALIAVSEDSLEAATKEGVFVTHPTEDRAGQNATAVAAALRRLLLMILSRVDTDVEARDRVIAKLGDANKVHYANLRELTEEFQTLLADFGQEVPLPRTIALPTCRDCRSQIFEPGDECPNCRVPFKRIGKYRVIDNRWLYHPLVGRKEFISVPAAGSTLPTLAEMNRHLESDGDLRILDRFAANSRPNNDPNADPRRVVVLVLNAPELQNVDSGQRLREKLEALVSCVSASVARRPALAIQSVDTYQGKQGVRCLWRPHSPREATVHVWWSRHPFLNDQWESVSEAAEGHAAVPGEETSYTITVSEDQELHVAVGIEQAGVRIGPCRAEEAIQAKAPRTEPETEPEDAAPIMSKAAAAEPTRQPSVCPACQAEVPAGREFCSRCGSPVEELKEEVRKDKDKDDTGQAVRVDDLDYRIVRQIEQAGDSARLLVEIEGTCQQFIDAPSSGPLDKLWTSVSNEDSPPAALPAMRRYECQSGRLHLLAAPRAANVVSIGQWCRKRREANQLEHRLPGVVLQLLDALAALQSQGYAYGLLVAERIAIAEPSDQVWLDWPLEPSAIGRTSPESRAPLGYVCPEFGCSDAEVQPNWDYYSLGVALLWSLVGKEPPESVSHLGVPHATPRVVVPDLPVGWAGYFDKLIAKRPGDRFVSAEEAAQAAKSLRGSSGIARLAYRVAAAQHVGVGKVQRNPRNQDRCFFWLPGGSTSESVQKTVDQTYGDESFLTDESAGEGQILVAVSDGISTVDSGEFAAQAIVDGLHEFSNNRPLADASPKQWLAELFEETNGYLGKAMAEAVEAETGGDSFLDPDQSPSATLVTMAFNERGAAVACVGDSRAYLLRHGVLEQLTVDGNQFTLYLKEGLDVEAAVSREDAKELVSWIGLFETVDGLLMPGRPSPVTRSKGFWSFGFQPKPGDVYCCCSDGISDYVDTDEDDCEDRKTIDLASILVDDSPREACRRLVEEANKCGGGDNISVVVIHVAEREA